MSTTTARPRQTTMAGVMVMLGAAFVVLSVWDEVSRLRSIESREYIETVLADLPGSRLSVEAGIQVAHAVAIVAALCAVAAIALGWEVLQRNNKARVALSVLAVPLFLSGVVAGFSAALVAAATVFLWVSPSREWFAGQPLPETGTKAAGRMQVWEQTPRQAPDHSPADKTPALSTPSTSSTPSTGWSVSSSASGERPGPVTVALVLTVVVASVVFIMTLASMVLLVTQPDVVLEEVRRQNPDLDSSVTETLLLRTSYASGALVIIWSALAIVLAVLTALRRAWAARALMICAALTGFLCVVATLASPIALVPAVAAVATVSCLRRPDVQAWLEDR